MSGEAAFIELLRAAATDPAARNLNDDCAVLKVGSETLVITHDAMAQDVHFLPYADPTDIAWKLVAVNLSDLAAKGAEPLGVLLGFTLSDSDWDSRFAAGLSAALAKYDVALLGGDTVGGEGRRVLGLTALGRAAHHPVPSRGGANSGDALWVTGVLGDAKAGFDLIRSGKAAPESLLSAYNRPQPLLQQGLNLTPQVSAMMDISDGLLLDAQRMAKASGLALNIQLDAIPLSSDYIAICGEDMDARLQAASWGDDYQLLFARPTGIEPVTPATCIGQFSAGDGLAVTFDGTSVSLPDHLGFEHS